MLNHMKNLQISDDVVGHIKFNEVIRNITEIHLDQNNFVTYRNEGGLTFKIIVLNCFRLILIIQPHDELT